MEHAPAIPARLIGFVISPVAARVAPAGPLTSKPSKAAPNYPDIMPRQQMIERTPTVVGGRKALQVIESQATEHRIKLIGDWYAARVYALLAKKFHLDAWRASIQQKQETIEDVSTMVAENFSVSFHTALDFILIGGWFLLLAGWFVYLFIDLYLLSLR